MAKQKLYFILLPLIALLVTVFLIFNFPIKQEKIIVNETQESKKEESINPPGTITVELTANGFVPNNIQVKRWTIIKIVNKDVKQHTLTFSNAPIETPLPPNDSLEYPDTGNLGTFKIIDLENNFELIVTVI